mmetsp:Transcript_32166/g.99343  ORF Transcript_32166/g.99343 Transcript_32166/m.99343 type:complete len:149 (-) Transcript_32166:63-509(-)
MVVSAKAGVKHLQDKLDGVREEIGGKQSQLTDETTSRVMSENEKVMIEILARIRVATDDESSTGAGGNVRTGIVSEMRLLEARPYNQRIDLPLLEDDWDDSALKDNEDVLNGELDDELTRDKVKRASSQILIARKQKKRNSREEPGHT